MSQQASRVTRLRYGATCTACQHAVAAGTEAWWDREKREVTCLGCRPRDPAHFVAGASAQRTADRRLQREREKRQQAGWFKKVVIAWQDKPSAARPWARGAEGERIVGARLDQLQAEGVIAALHDVRIPGTAANVDHVAVAPSGVHVIDAKLYTGRVEVANRGGWINKDIQLRVGKRNRTPLVDKLTKQILTVDAALRDITLPTPVTPVLCFVKADWALLTKAYKLNSVHIVWPKQLVKLLQRPGPLTPDQIRHVGDVLRHRLRPA